MVSASGCFPIVWHWFFVSGATNKTSSTHVSRGYCKAKHSSFKRSKEERIKESVGKYRPTIERFVFGRTKFTRSSWIAYFAVDILLLRHYESDLAHLSDFDSLVNKISESKI